MNTAPPLQPLLHTLALPACRNLASCILQYLAPEDLQSLCQAGESSNSPNYFLTLARNLRFLSQFINRTDKSLYFTFFAEPQYKSIEAQQAATVAQQAEPIFLILHQQCKAVLAMLMERVPALQEEIEVLTNLLSDPDLPLPKLKRETQGMYCTSPFQLFLVDCTFRQDEQEYFCFEALRDFLSSEREEDYVRQFMALLKERHGAGAAPLRRVKQLRYTPYEVTAGNFKDFLLQDNQLHNFIVGLFALTDVLVQATHAYISRISDPLQRLVQLLLRYSIFRNYVLAIQEYLAFAFKLYENIYHDAIEQDPRKPQFRFWRPAMTKWFLRMDYLHQQGTQVYFHCLTRLRNTHLTAALAELAEQDQQRYGKLRNEVELNGFQHALGEKVYGAGMVTGSEVGLFFDQHPQNYEMVVMEFNEYLVDVSVNEQTVHWCGHSSHQLEQPYLTYQSLLLELNSQYARSLLGNFSPADKHDLVKLDAEYLSILQIKNRTLKALVGAANRQLGLFGQSAVGFDFDQADRKLQFFNAKALILSSVDEHERPFYSIPPLCSPDKLIDMLDTNDSSNNNTDQEVFQYRSDEEHEHTHKAKEGREKEAFQDQEEERTEGSMIVGRKPVGLKKVFAEDMQGSSSLPLLRAKQLAEEF